MVYCRLLVGVFIRAGGREGDRQRGVLGEGMGG